MAEILQMPDGYGGRVGERYRMPARPGSHVVYARGSDLVVEWYDFGEHAPYESANLIVFDRPAQQQLMRLAGEDESQTPHAFACVLARRFGSYFEIRQFAEANGIAFATETDFTP